MVKIRLTRRGKKKQPFYKIVITDARNPRDGKFIEEVGWYDPRGKEIALNLQRVKLWLSRGAQPTERVAKLIKLKEVQNERPNRNDS
jgi:small subunit ribosomal protein S16